MSQLVFGPHPTGLTLFGLHIPLVSTSVYLDDGASIPAGLQVVGTGPTGQNSSCEVANGTAMTVSGIGNLNVEYHIDDCTDIPGSQGAPERFSFRVTLRAVGSVSIKLITIPVNIQVDSFEVVLAKDAATHLKLLNQVPVAAAV